MLPISSLISFLTISGVILGNGCPVFSSVSFFNTSNLFLICLSFFASFISEDLSCSPSVFFSDSLGALSSYSFSLPFDFFLATTFSSGRSPSVSSSDSLVALSLLLFLPLDSSLASVFAYGLGEALTFESGPLCSSSSSESDPLDSDPLESDPLESLSLSLDSDPESESEELSTFFLLFISFFILYSSTDFLGALGAFSGAGDSSDGGTESDVFPDFAGAGDSLDGRTGSDFFGAFGPGDSSDIFGAFVGAEDSSDVFGAFDGTCGSLDNGPGHPVLPSFGSNSFGFLATGSPPWAGTRTPSIS